MGLLDEAIREHLDLKRRRGADPAEIERAEREALGPVRRQPEPAEPVDAGVVPPVPDDQAAPEDAATVTSEKLAYDPAGGEEPQFGFEDEPLEPPLPVSAPSVPAADPPGPETIEYDVEQEQVEETAAREAATREPAEDETGAPRGEGTPEDTSDDMLEETPEFLQDTPDHDRLWFEQRPPRDFDFEG